LVLWNPREHPNDFLPAKLSPKWLGPYEVIEQKKNDVKCVHLCLRTTMELHVTRLKPFFGSREAAMALAQLDQNQFRIFSFNWFTGNPHLRTSMQFNVSFEDEIVILPYSADLAGSQQFDAYVHSKPVLFPLRFETAIEAKRHVAAIARLSITTVTIGDEAYLDLRFFDGLTSAWYDHIGLPHRHLTYVTSIRFVRWSRSHHKCVIAYVAALQNSYELNAYDMQAYIHKVFDDTTMSLVTRQVIKQYHIQV